MNKIFDKGNTSAFSRGNASDQGEEGDLLVIEVDSQWRNGFCQARLMRVSASGNAEELVRPLYVSEPAFSFCFCFSCFFNFSTFSFFSLFVFSICFYSVLFS